MSTSQLKSEFNKIVKYCETYKTKENDAIFQFCKSVKKVDSSLIQKLYELLGKTSVNNDNQLNHFIKGAIAKPNMKESGIAQLLTISMSKDRKEKLDECLDFYLKNKYIDTVVPGDMMFYYISLNKKIEKSYIKYIIYIDYTYKPVNNYCRLIVTLYDNMHINSYFVYYNITSKSFTDTNLDDISVQDIKDMKTRDNMIEILNNLTTDNQSKSLSFLLSKYATRYDSITFILTTDDYDDYAFFKYDGNDNNLFFDINDPKRKMKNISYYDNSSDTLLTKYDIAFDTANNKFVSFVTY